MLRRPLPPSSLVPSSKGRSLPRTLLILVLVAVAGPGCHCIARYESTTLVPAHQCTGDVVVYGDSSNPATLQANIQTSAYTGLGTTPLPEVVFSNTQATGPVELYSRFGTSGTWVSENTPSPVTGAMLIQVASQDRTLSGALFTLSFADRDAVSDVYVAFDDRASLPTWLSTGAGTGGPGFTPATVSLDPDGTLRTTSKERGVQRRLRLYKLNGPVPASLTFFGNNHEPAVWGGSAPGLQYLVFVRGKPVPNTATKLKVGSHKIEFCDDPTNPITPGASPQTINPAAELDKWLAGNHGAWKQAKADGLLGLEISLTGCPTVPDPVTPGASKICRSFSPDSGCFSGDGYDIQNFPHKVTSWIRESQASLTSASNAAVSSGGGPASISQLSGQLSFRIAEGGRVEIGEVSFFGTPFTLDGASVTGLSFRQVETIWAECAGSPVLANTLCSDYDFPPDTFVLAGGADLSGHELSVIFRNQQPIHLHVDHTQSTFHLSGGSLTGTFDAGNGPITVVLTVVGHFDNFAPIASLEETSDRFPCIDNRQGTVLLDGRASHDDSGPLASYTWIEDAGLPSQRVLGTAPVLETDLNFGEHRILLQVEDATGTLASTEKVVTVYDDRIDSWQAPPDVVVASQGGSTPVYLGSAGASDGCSGAVGISNDAPALFPDGLTLVEWTFDDYLGNVVHHVQKVFVVPPAAYPPPRSWAWGGLEVPVGDPQGIFYGTTAQGVAVAATEYLLLLTPSGETFSFDSANQPSAAGVLLPHGEALFGLHDTWGLLWLDPLEAEFPDQGLYVFSHVLVRPGGSPDIPADILALEWWPFLHGSLP